MLKLETEKKFRSVLIFNLIELSTYILDISKHILHMWLRPEKWKEIQ